MNYRPRREPSRRILPPDEWYPAGESAATVRFVETRSGDRLRVVECGPSGAPAVVLLHGWGASAYSFRHLLPLLARAGLRGVAPDLPGHGLSTKPLDERCYTSPAMSGNVLEMTDALDLTRFVLVGQSMGGAIALDTAMRAAERTQGVVLVAPVGLTEIRRISVARALRASRWMPGWVPRWGISLLLRRLYGSLGHFDERDIDEYWAPTQFPEFPRALFLMVNAFDWTPRPGEGFVRLGGRVRMVLGGRDKLVTVARALVSARVVPASHVTVVEGAGHLLAEEAPEHVAQAVVHAMNGDR